MPVQALTLEGLTSAEFKKAERLFRHAARVQVALLIISGLTIFVTAAAPTLIFAIVSALLFAAWAALDWQYRASRGQAERGRRMLLIVEGLGDDVSIEEQRDVEEGFSVTSDEGRNAENPDFFASERPRGNARLIELLEESAFYSCRLFRLSASRAWSKFALFTVACLLLFLSSITIADVGELTSGGRILCTILIFLISQEILGNGRDYGKAYQALSTIQARIRAVRSAGYPQADLLVLLSDYNSAVEGAPMMAPGIYERNASELDALWRRHLNDTLADRRGRETTDG